MGLPGGELERDRQAMRASVTAWILVVRPPRERPMQTARRSAIPAVPAERFAPLFALAPCWWTRIDELSTDCSDPS